MGSDFFRIFFSNRNAQLPSKSHIQWPYVEDILPWALTFSEFFSRNRDAQLHGAGSVRWQSGHAQGRSGPEAGTLSTHTLTTHTQTHTLTTHTHTHTHTHRAAKATSGPWGAFYIKWCTVAPRSTTTKTQYRRCRPSPAALVLKSTLSSKVPKKKSTV